MTTTQIRGNKQIQAGTIFDAQIASSAAIASSKLADGANFLKKDGSVAMTADLNLNSHKITNLANPSASTDAANKSYVDTAVTGMFKADGSVQATGAFDLNSHQIHNVTDPSSAQDAATKHYVDALDAADLKKDGSVALTGDLDAGTHKIINLSDPASAQDAATKAYVDGVAQGLQLKQSVRAASTANLTLSGTQTVDGVALIAGDRILVKDQTAGQDNGIYVVASGAWSRSADLDQPAELKAGIFTFVEEGTSQHDTGWVLVTDNPITLGTDPQLWSQFSGAGSINAGAGLTETGSTIDVVSANGGIVVNADNIALTVADASLAITSSGVKIASGTAGQVLVANGSGVPVAATLSGDVSSVSSSGAVTLASSVVKSANIILHEIPSGAVDSSNVTFTLANTPISGSEEVYLNGILLDPNSGNDYSISGAVITMVSAPDSGDKVRVNYRK